MSLHPTIPVLFEDQDIAIVIKPANLVVNRADTVKEYTLQDWWQERLGHVSDASAFSSSSVAATFAKDWQSMVPSDFAAEYGTPEEIFTQRGGIVHRLDKETSGVMVLAKNPGSLVQLLRQFRVREVDKMYTCLVHGKFTVLEDTLLLPLGRSTYNRTKFSVDAEGRVAQTHYKVVKMYSKFNEEQVVLDREGSGQEAPANFRKKASRTYQGFSLVQCWPKTGRTHQIRVHMQHIRHPIVSDQTYLGAKRSSLDEAWCSRLFLHASLLAFAHPRTGKRVEFQAELPSELNAALKYLSEQ